MKRDLRLEIVICDYETRAVWGKRVKKNSFSCYEPWIHMLNHIYEQRNGLYNESSFCSQIGELYDNHTIDEIYEMQGNHELVW